jgi:protein arginine N-methyltransferase 1
MWPSKSSVFLGRSEYLASFPRPHTTTEDIQVPNSEMACEEPMQTEETLKKEENKTAKDYYFESYSHFGIHEEMLKDVVRTDTYRKSIVNNRHLFEGKTVLDVGCGTGILCMFAATAGAARVIGVDMADIADTAVQIVEENGFSDRITIIKGKVEEIQLPDGIEQVDIIISEWMGYFLLYESMVDSVFYARDKWLAPDGMLFPDKARLHVCAIEDEQYRQEKVNFWDDVYGYKMSAIKATAMTEPLVDVVPANQIISDSCCILEMDLYKMTIEDCDFGSNFEITINRQDFCHGFTAYFDVEFSKCHIRTGFTTAPFADYTHWKQTVFYLDEPIRGTPGEKIQGSIKVQKHPKNPRDLIIDLESTSQYGTTQSRRYLMR